MKVLCAEYNAGGDLAVVPVGDDVLLRNNGDFYVPEFTGEVSCVPQLVVRMCKLGKSVSERFAGRYYEEVGVGVRFYADTLEAELRKKGLPEVMAASFDSSAAISALKNRTGLHCIRYAMKVNEETVFEGDSGGLPVSPDKLVSVCSDYHTIKIGDFVYCGNTFRHRGMKIGDRVQVYLEGECMLDFYIR